MERTMYVIDVRCQILKIVAAVEVDIVIYFRENFLCHRPRQPLHLGSVWIARKYTVQVFAIGKSETARTFFKGRTV